LEEVDPALQKLPDAVEIRSYETDDSTFDVPLSEIGNFIKEYPDAKPMYKYPSLPSVKAALDPVELFPVKMDEGIYSNVKYRHSLFLIQKDIDSNELKAFDSIVYSKTSTFVVALFVVLISVIVMKKTLMKGLEGLKMTKYIVLMCAIVVVSTGLFPPWLMIHGHYEKSAGYSFLLNQPNQFSQIDYGRLCIQWFLIIVFFGAILFCVKSTSLKKVDSWAT
jgi:hypothetical protein